MCAYLYTFMCIFIYKGGQDAMPSNAKKALLGKTHSCQANMPCSGIQEQCAS